MAGKLITALTAASGGELATTSLLAGMAAAGSQARKFTIAQIGTILGLGTAAAATLGTSGATVPLLSTANTWSLKQSFSTDLNGVGGFFIQADGTRIMSITNTGKIIAGTTRGYAWGDVAGLTTDTAWTRASAGVVLVTNGDTATGGAIQTGDPTSGNGGVWKLGTIKSGAVVLDAGNYIEVSIGGTTKKVLIAS